MDERIVEYIDTVFSICEKTGGGGRELNWNGGWLSIQFFIEIEGYQAHMDIALVVPDNTVWIRMNCSNLQCSHQLAQEIYESRKRAKNFGHFYINVGEKGINIMGLKEVDDAYCAYPLLPEYVDMMIDRGFDLAKHIGEQWSYEIDMYLDEDYIFEEDEENDYFS